MAIKSAIHRLIYGSRKGHPPIDYAHSDHPAMLEAIEKARRTVDEFISALQSPKRSQTNFVVKFEFTEGKKSEHMWLSRPRFENGYFVGELGNKPDRLKKVKMGDEIKEPIEKISDWAYIDNGRLVGGYTIRVSRSLDDEESRQEFDERVPFVVTEDVDPEYPLVHFFDAIGNGEYDQMRSLLKEHPEFANQKGKVAIKSPLEEMELISWHPLFYAIYHGDYYAAEILLQNGSDPEFRLKNRVPMHEAAKWGCADIIELLAKYGGDVDAKNRIGGTPLKAAARNHHLNCVTTLLKLNADVNIKTDDNGEGLLHNIKSTEIAKVLLGAGVEIDGRRADLSTPLHVAFVNEYVELAEYLIKAGASLTLKDEDGKTPLDLAKERLSTNDYQRILNAVKESRDSD